MPKFKVVLPGRAHFSSYIIVDLESKKKRMLDCEYVNQDELDNIVNILKEHNLDEDELGEICVIGPPDEPMPTGRVCLVGHGVSIECDAGELARALKPFIKRNSNV
jgi:hypothetical protein